MKSLPIIEDYLYTVGRHVVVICIIMMLNAQLLGRIFRQNFQEEERWSLHPETERKEKVQDGRAITQFGTR